MENTQVKIPGEPAADSVRAWPATAKLMLGPVYRFVRSRAPADAVDDLVQETFAAACRGIKEFDGRCPIWNWLTAIARNKIADHYRRSGSQDVLTEALDVLDAGHVSVERALVCESLLPDEICQRQEFHLLARAALSALSPEQQECLVARYYEDLSLQDVARRLGISLSLANTRLYRARKALKREFLDLLGIRPDEQESSS